MKYLIAKSEYGNSILKVVDGTYLAVPEDNGNKDYQEYLDWLAQGNTPEENNNGMS